MFGWLLSLFRPVPTTEEIPRDLGIGVFPFERSDGEYALSFENFLLKEMEPPVLKARKLPERRIDRVRLLSYHPSKTRPEPSQEPDFEGIRLEAAPFNDPDFHIPMHVSSYIETRYPTLDENSFSGWYKKIRIRIGTDDDKDI